MIKIDTHSHTSGVSFCSEVSPAEFVSAYKKAGITTVMLTNHYSRLYMFRYGDNWQQQIEIYLNEFGTVKREGDRTGVNILMGAEVAISTPESDYIEFLLYGADENFFLSNPCLYDLSQKQLYKTCNDKGVLMLQSHPFRSEHGHVLLDPEFMDGTELNNHPYFIRHEDKVFDYVNKFNKMLVCGSDLHYVRQAGSAYTLFPDNTASSKDFADYLRINPRPEIFYK